MISLEDLNKKREFLLERLEYEIAVEALITQAKLRTKLEIIELAIVGFKFREELKS